MGIGERIYKKFSKDIGIDLGTANTLVYVSGKGIVINEPSVVALNIKTKQILAIGNDAKRMVGRTPTHIVAIRPLVDGVVSDFEITEQMLKYFINKVQHGSPGFFSRPQVVVGIPSGGTDVERRAVHDAALNAGARAAFLIEEPMAAAIGARLPVQDASGSMIVDIGGGTTEIAVISLGGIVVSKSIRVAGDEMNESIIQYAREEFNLLLGVRTAEDVKITVGSAFPQDEVLETVMRGRDMISGLPKEVVVNDTQIREALTRSVRGILNAVKEAVEQTPPELVADIMTRGITLAGGGVLLRGFDKLVAKETLIPVHLCDDPLTAVVRGTGVVLEDLDNLREVLIQTEFEKVPS
ncbi:MAG: rod shape-determining protein [Candidatus Doudnabacteria bacterium CG10_big_fil_rev_8_21_14_0_10_41_10]|uniref:Cell shape-determining protein MreB n=1 Tax=Candidatus Doudnabacteria bacterium CG10_big_fil_rev_8_21_14_0_10_41_10 TaxID=1974551 RepID=A0A2H0VC84_9BACT|nr:MAG: rod shape-determining protein [Candidatus Doudnabacteria bacterium CG10_big_fil_rev_8_21_14_0_10_41_10]